MPEENKRETTAEKIKKFFADFKKLSAKKKTQYIAILIIIAVILTIYFSSLTEKPKPDSSTGTVKQTTAATASAAAANTDDSTEVKLQETLTRIDGAGKVQVMITYKSGPEIVPAFSTDTQKNSTTDNSDDSKKTTESVNEQTDVVTVEKSGDANALILKEKAPDVKGVIVIAEGAGDIGVKLNLLKAVETILAVSPDQVEIFEMKKG